MNEVAVKSEDLMWTPGTDDLGFEGVSNGCVKQGFLKIAQFSSDEIKKGNAKYITGLEVGQFYCPQRRKVYGTNFLAVSLKFWQSYAVYDGEGTASKFKGNMTVAEFEKNVRPNAKRVRSYMMDDKGYRYVDSRNFLVIPYDKPLEVPMIFSLSSTAITASRDWLTLMESLTTRVMIGETEKEVPVPMRAGVWKLSSAYTTNDQGDFYKLIAPEFVGLTDTKIDLGGFTLKERVNNLYLEAKTMDVLMITEDEATREAETESKGESKAESNVKNMFGNKSAAKEAESDVPF